MGNALPLVGGVVTLITVVGLTADPEKKNISITTTRHLTK